MKVSINRLNELLEKKLEKEGNEIIDNIKKIEFKDVNYVINDHKLMKSNITYKINNPGIYIIIGNNGSGKTTLINTLIGLYNSKIVGEIKINDLDIEEIKMTKLRRDNMSIMLQSELFPEITLRNYIKIYLKVDNLKKILYSSELLKQIFVSDIFNLEDHLDKSLQDLSSGEKQMISLFRALIKEKDIYIFDEPTSNINLKLKNILIFVFKELVRQEKIVLIVTHDNEIIKVSDNVIDIS